MRIFTRSLPIVLVLLVAGCSSPETPSGDQPAASPTLDGCGGIDHPCTLAGISAEADTRTRELTEQILPLVGPAGEMDEAEAYLRDQPDVISVATGPGTIRFRVRGGRGHWIVSGTQPNVATLGGGLPVTTAGLAPGTTVALPRQPWIPSGPPQLQGGQSGPAPDARPLKRALLISPFLWQWEMGGVDDGTFAIAQLLNSRDYRNRVNVHAMGLNHNDPDCAVGQVRWPDGSDDVADARCDVVGNVTLDSFTSWNDYEYVHLVTHGGAVAADGASLTGVMAPWTVEGVQAFRNRVELDGEVGEPLLDIIDTIGLETATVYGVALGAEYTEADVPRVGPGQTRWAHIPRSAVTAAEDQAFREGQPLPLNPDLTPAEAAWCARNLQDVPDSRRMAAGRKPLVTNNPAAKVCGNYGRPRVGTGNFVMLTSAFFKEIYGSGVDDAVLVMSACSAGFADDLLQALNGNRTTVFGWNQSVTIQAAAAAGRLIARTLVEVDEAIEDDSGLTANYALRKIRELIDEARSNAPTQAQCEAADGDPDLEAACAMQYGKALSVINDLPADALTGAMLRLVGDEDNRARETVYLMDGSGRELADGGTLTLVGLDGDEQNDAVDLTFRLDGLEPDENPAEVSLEIRVDDRPIPVNARLNRERAGGVWEVKHELPLGRDYADGDEVDLEVRATRPRGEPTRWVYEDVVLRLAPLCEFHATVSGGPYAGSYTGPATKIGNGIILADHATDWEALIEIPSTDPGEYPAEVSAIAARRDIDGQPNYWWARSTHPGGSGSVRVIEATGDLDTPGRNSNTRGEARGHLAWRENPTGYSFIDVEIVFSAAGFGVGSRSTHRQCLAAWNAR